MDRDISIIRHIINHIEDILKSQKRFGTDPKIFSSDTDYFNSVCMSLLQIGELSNHLSESFTKAHAEIPWKKIVGLRNVVVHGYGQLDSETVWTTVIEDVPELYKKCQEIIDMDNRNQIEDKND